MHSTMNAPKTIAPETARAPATTIAPSPAVPFATDEIDFARVIAKVKNDPWLLPKLFILLGAASPAAVAIGFALVNESAGVAIAIIPDMLAAAFLLGGILFCTLFFDDEEHA